MSESLHIDSPFRGWAMAKACSGELRERVIEAVEMGASRREAAELFEVSVSSAIKWLQRWRDSGSAAAPMMVETASGCDGPSFQTSPRNFGTRIFPGGHTGSRRTP
jgi:transposase-like protein